MRHGVMLASLYIRPTQMVAYILMCMSWATSGQVLRTYLWKTVGKAKSFTVSTYCICKIKKERDELELVFVHTRYEHTNSKMEAEII